MSTFMICNVKHFPEKEKMILARIFLLLRIFFSQGTLKKPKKGLQSVTCLQTKKCDRIGLQSAAWITKSNGIPS